MNSIGPMARYAVDLLPMMKVMAAKEKLSELRLDKPVDVKKLRIFYQEEIFNGKFVSPVSICRFKVRSRPSFIILHSRLTKKFKLHSGK
jgi:fatty acid amide hydrolase 2